MRLQSALQPTLSRTGAVGLDQIPFGRLGRAGAGAGAGASQPPSARSEASEQTQGGAAPAAAPAAASGAALAPAPLPAPVPVPVPDALSAPPLASNAPLDGLQQMLADKAAERSLNAQKRTRISAEVDVLMDNGVRINPLCEQMYGGDRRGEAAADPSLAAHPVASAAAQSSAPGGTVDELEFDDDDY